MASRATRGMASLQDAIEKLSVREKLLLSQAIYECGSAKWDEVSKMVVSHPLTERPNTFFSPTVRGCFQPWSLAKKFSSVGQPMHDSNPFVLVGQTSRSGILRHLEKMAWHFYQQHVQDLKTAIAAEEARFKTLTTEIEEINAGKWDDKILAELNPSSEAFARPSASPLPRHLTLETTELSLRQDSPSDAGRPHSPAGRSTRDGTPAEPGGLASLIDRSKPVSTASSGSRPWNSKDNKRVREMKERRMRERLASMVSDTPEQPDDALPDSAPPTPVVGTSGNELVEAPVPPPATETPKNEEGAAPVVADEVREEEEVVQSSQPKEEAKAAKSKRRASDVSMTDVPREPKRPRQEDTEMVDASTAAPTGNSTRTRFLLAPSHNPNPESPEPSTSTQSAPVTARPSIALTSTPTPTPAATAPVPQTNKKFQSVIGMVHSQIYQLRGGNIFHNPIKKSEAPDYYEIVRRPMDLKTVKARIKDGLVSSTDHFKRDVYLMFANAIMYNRPGTSVNDIAAEMMLESEKHIADFRAAEEFNKPGRG
ncbi:hypothetical protein FRC10_001061 [Ceratobasidium sp. 414]|nr:hypothetical protein FRC10_001061 [Ceratobasidium sp. 414]